MTLTEPNADSSKPFYGSLAMGFESISAGKSVLATMGGNNKKWGWLLDGVYRKNENYSDGNGNIVPFSQFEKYNIHSAIKYNINTQHSFKLDVLYDKALNVGYPALPMDVSLASAALYAIEYQRKGKIEIKAKAYYNDVVHIMDDSQRDSLYRLKEKPEGKSDSVYMRMDMPGRSSTLGAYFQLSTFWNPRNKLTFKVDNYTNNSVAEMTMHMRYAGFAPEAPMYMQTWPATLRNVAGVFVENTSVISTNFSILANLRVDYNTDKLQSEYGQQQFSIFAYNLPGIQSKFVKSFNITGQYRITSRLFLNASTGYAERMPNVTERLGFYLFNAYDAYDYIGNPYLQSEKSTFFKMDLIFSSTKFKVNFGQSFSLITDYIIGINNHNISAMNFSARGIRVYQNVPKANLYNANLQLSYSPAREITGFWLAKFTHGNIASTKAMPLIPPLKNIMAIKHQKDKLMLQLECETALAQKRINVDYGESVTPGYAVFNAKCGYAMAFKDTKLDIGCGITNLLNRVYYEHLDWGRIFRPGRSAELFARVSF